MILVALGVLAVPGAKNVGFPSPREVATFVPASAVRIWPPPIFGRIAGCWTLEPPRSQAPSMKKPTPPEQTGFARSPH